MKFSDEMILTNSKLNEVVNLSIGKVKVIENNGCDGCIIKQTINILFIKGKNKVWLIGVGS